MYLLTFRCCSRIDQYFLRALVNFCGGRDPCCKRHEALLAVQNGVHFRSPIQLNNSGYPPGPINSFNFAWTVVSQVLYPQELLWTVRCISACTNALCRTPHHAFETSANQKENWLCCWRCPQARLLPLTSWRRSPSSQTTEAEHPRWRAPVQQGARTH